MPLSLNLKRNPTHRHKKQRLRHNTNSKITSINLKIQELLKSIANVCKKIKSLHPLIHQFAKAILFCRDNSLTIFLLLQPTQNQQNISYTLNYFNANQKNKLFIGIIVVVLQ